MAAPIYVSYTAVTTGLTAPMAGVATSSTANTVKTILQVKPGSSKIRIVSWGFSYASTPTAPVLVELVTTDVAATVTSGSISSFNDATGASSLATTGTAATGFNASAEGTITTTRLLDFRSDVNNWPLIQFPLGREPEVNTGTFLRIRATPTTSASTTVYAWVAWEE